MKFLKSIGNFFRMIVEAVLENNHSRDRYQMQQDLELEIQERKNVGQHR